MKRLDNVTEDFQNLVTEQGHSACLSMTSLEWKSARQFFSYLEILFHINESVTS